MNPLIPDCTGVILAGGENTRMPVLKAFIKVKGQSIIQRNTSIMKRLFREVFIVTNQPEYYAHLDAILLGDVYDIRGPMTGILTALLNSSYQWIFVTACDMPFINEDLIIQMSRNILSRNALSKQGRRVNVPRMSNMNNCYAVVPSVNGYTESLFAFYSCRLSASMERSVRAGKTSVKNFLHNQGKRVQYITSQEINKIDPGAYSFINLNSPGDVKKHLRGRDTIAVKRLCDRRKKCLV